MLSIPEGIIRSNSWISIWFVVGSWKFHYNKGYDELIDDFRNACLSLKIVDLENQLDCLKRASLHVDRSKFLVSLSITVIFCSVKKKKA